MIIGFTGKAGAGKDTAAAVLTGSRFGFTQIAFADPMRRMMGELLGPLNLTNYMTDRDLKERVIPSLGVSYRHMMQTLGTEWGRSLGEAFWINLAQAYINNHAQNRWVISDVRFPNEAEWIRSQGGRVIHIARPDLGAARGHASEEWAGRLGEDYTVNNVGSIGDFQRKVFDLAELIRQEAK